MSRYGVFATGENIFGISKPTKTFDTQDEAVTWADAHNDEPGRGWIVSEVGDTEFSEDEPKVESYNGPHPKRSANLEATIEAAMRFPVEWQEGFSDGFDDLSTGATYDDDPESDRSRAYDVGRNAGDLERLRLALRAENISMGELVELQGLEAWIDPGDPELLEAAGVPEFDDSDDDFEFCAVEGCNFREDDGHEHLDEVDPFDLATIDTERNMRYVVHPFVSSELYVNYCGLCALSASDHSPGPDFVDPFDDTDEDDVPAPFDKPELYDEWGEDGDPEPVEPDPDAMYDAARDEAHNRAVEDGRPDSWRDYMPGRAAPIWDADHPDGSRIVSAAYFGGKASDYRDPNGGID